ncbi:phosphoglycolate phosphatase [Alysiella filiformis]|uniref:Phosphoglycolate phosphatase n=1 Tax=Alysiella filiformis DSM 16848 TaxID=1120981 RepID=A0A286EG71_9NEIS|nr:phosphoglycolate phosphatase [Alysiella filiformis]QMT30509.1 phosphoglycolate phosphatase [Alysiella filiformis]UBQ56511.1 phosphoglycolate phosphatase [Alysiella filiformis DSM 16848]SOD69911.1 phosphoglycolate phosphatase [Alysiella filiformis DSM 16848]
MPIPAPIHAVVFDLDGTLCDSVPDLAASANAMRAALGFDPLPQDVVQSYVGDGVGVLVHRAITADHHGQAEQSLWERGFSEFVRHYHLNIANATRPYPQTETGLGLLKSLGLPLAVLTNKSEKLAVKLLQDLALDGYFSMIVGGDTLPERKPAAEPLLHIADVLGVAPQNVLMVGDSLNDILCAKAAGSPVVGVTFGYGDVSELNQNPDTQPNAWVDSLPEIYEQLRLQKQNER